jgi:hypothetical protein
MDTRQDNSTQSAKEAADTLVAQANASAEAAEAIEKARRSAAITPRKSVRSAPSLNTDINFARENKRESAYPSTDERYASEAYSDLLVQNTGRNREEQKPIQPKTYRYEDEAPNYKTRRRRQVRQDVRDKLAGKALPSTLTLAKTSVARARVSSINITFISFWGWALWLAQFIFGLIGVLCIGIVAGIDALTSGEGGFFAWITSKVTNALDAILKFIGLDFAEIAIYVFIASYAIVLSIGLLMMGILYLEYKLAFVNPIFGKTGSSAKVGAVLLTFITLAVPGLNFFPVILLWMTAVWFYPK